MSSEEIVQTAVVQSERTAGAPAILVEAQTRATLMKSMLPHLIAVCNKTEIMSMGNGDKSKPYIVGSGCQKIARIAGISFGTPNIEVSYEDLPAEPAEYWPDSGKERKPAKPVRRAFIVEVAGEASVMGQTVFEVGGASSEDGFFQRPNESPIEIRLEVRKKAIENWRVRCVHTLLGLNNLTWDEVGMSGAKEATAGGVKYREGRHSSQKDTSGDQQAADDNRKKISDQILTDVANHKEAAGDLLERMTAFTGKDGKEVPGVRSTQKLSDGRAETTWNRIKPSGKDRDAYQLAVADINDKYDLWSKEAQT